MVRSLVRNELAEHQVGADNTLNIALWDGADALVVTGMTAAFKLYRGKPGRARKPWTGNAVLTKTSAAGEITLTDGNAAVAIADTDLADKSGSYWFILLLTTTATGAVAHRSQGQIELRAEPA